MLSGGASIHKHVVAPALVATLWLLALLLLMPAEAIIEKDSAGFISFAGKRTAGYPLFVYAVGLKGVLWVQPILAGLALFFLGFQTSRLTGSSVVAVALMAAIACCPPIFSYHYTVLAESLFMSVSMVLIGLLMEAAWRRDWRVVAIASLTGGIAAIVKPVAAALLPMMLFFALLLSFSTLLVVRRASLVAAALLPFVAVVGIEQAASTWRQVGAEREGLAVRHLFAKAAMIEAPALDGATQHPSRAAQVLAVEFAPIRALVARAPDFVTRSFLVGNYEACIQRRCSTKGVGVDPESRHARSAAWARIAENPRGYLALVWLTYRSLWTTWRVSHPASSPKVEAFIAGQRPLPLEPFVPGLVERLPIHWAAVVVQPLVLAIGMTTFCLLLLGLFYLLARRQVTEVAVLATTSALGVHGALFLTALTALPIGRYTFALWPFIVTSLVCAGLWLLENRGAQSWQAWLCRH
jgi:hypothetical protein